MRVKATLNFIALTVEATAYRITPDSPYSRILADTWVVTDDEQRHVIPLSSFSKRIQNEAIALLEAEARKLIAAADKEPSPLTVAPVLIVGGIA